MAEAADTFFSKLRPQAEKLRQLLGAGPNVVPVVLAQWAQESGFEAPQWIGGNNYSGLTNGGPPHFRVFATPEEHTHAQAEALTDPNFSSNYAPFLQAARENQSPTVLAQLLGISGWDADHYMGNGNTPGQRLISIMDRYKLFPAPAGLPRSVLFPPAFAPALPEVDTPQQKREEGAVEQPTTKSESQSKESTSSEQVKDQGWRESIVSFFGGLRATVFSWDWWKRALWLLILIIVALLLIYFSLRGMTNPPATTTGEGD